MFLENDTNYLMASFYTTRYLGNVDLAGDILSILSDEQTDWSPDTWDVEERERPRNKYSKEEVLSYWSVNSSSKCVHLFKNEPLQFQLSVRMERSKRTKFNTLRVYWRWRDTQTLACYDTVVRFVENIAVAVKCDYGYVAAAGDEKWPPPPLTPAERLPGVFWVNIFGHPYYDLFGRDLLLAAPCYDVKELDIGLVRYRLSKLPNENHGEFAIALKSHLGVDCFAGPEFPVKACRVPRFNFDDVRLRAF